MAGVNRPSTLAGWTGTACHSSSVSPTQHGTLGSGRSSDKGPSWSSRSLGARCRNSIASCPEEQPHVGNYRLLRTIGKGNFAKVKLARHILTGREVSEGRGRAGGRILQPWCLVGGGQAWPSLGFVSVGKSHSQNISDFCSRTTQVGEER